MADLIALTPCDGLLPFAHGDITITEILPEALTSVAPLGGQHAAVAAALGTALPACNRRSGNVMWFGHGVWMVTGPVSLDAGLAAVTDQSDAWAIVRIAGKDAETVLARLVPVDLRPTAFAADAVAKTMLGHLSVTITRRGDTGFGIMVMRSMAATLVHDLTDAVQGVAAR